MSMRMKVFGEIFYELILFKLLYLLTKTNLSIKLILLAAEIVPESIAKTQP